MSRNKPESNDIQYVSAQKQRRRGDLQYAIFQQVPCCVSEPSFQEQKSYFYQIQKIMLANH